MREDVGLQWSDDIESTRALGVEQKIRTVAHCCDPVTHLHFSDIKKELLSNVSWFVWWILVIYKPEFHPVHIYDREKNIKRTFENICF